MITPQALEVRATSTCRVAGAAPPLAYAHALCNAAMHACPPHCGVGLVTQPGADCSLAACRAHRCSVPPRMASQDLHERGVPHTHPPAPVHLAVWHAPLMTVRRTMHRHRLVPTRSAGWCDRGLEQHDGRGRARLRGPPPLPRQRPAQALTPCFITQLAGRAGAALSRGRGHRHADGARGLRPPRPRRLAEPGRDAQPAELAQHALASAAASRGRAGQSRCNHRPWQPARTGCRL